MSFEPLTPDQFSSKAGVSRETLARLQIYADLLVKWQKAVNLVGPGTLADIWRRHFLDSAQLLPLAPDGARIWVDLGSGAGFPGLVLAILGAADVHLIESDGRKCAFMQEVARLTEAKVQIHRCRIESAPQLRASICVARALAPLSKLLDYAERFSSQDTVCLFLKGQDVEAELTEAAKSWTMHIERLPSRSDPTGTILRVKGFHRGAAV